MKKLITITLFLLTILTTFSTVAQRGRVKIQNGNVVADNGKPLRGAPFFLDISWGIEDMLANEKLFRDYFKKVSAENNMNMVRACPWLGGYDYKMSDVVGANGRTAGDRVKAMLDLLVKWTREDNIYLLINAHSQINTYVDYEKWKDFWTITASRYKDETHVFYEAINEPDVTSGVNNMESIYSYIRGQAPNTHIVMWTHWSCDIPLSTIQAKTGISYTNASVGFHTYMSEGDLRAWDRAKAIRDAGYPVICTELWSLTNANNFPIDYDELSLHIAKGEQYGMSWAQWGPYANYQSYNPTASYFTTHDMLKFTAQYKTSIEQRGVTYWAKDNGTTTTPPPASTTDDVVSVTAPASVNPNTNVTVTVNYSATTNRDIHVAFQLQTSPYTTYGSVKVDVTAGNNQTVNITVPIGSSTPIANSAYQFQVFMTTDGGSWSSGRLDYLPKTNVSASISSTTALNKRIKCAWGNKQLNGSNTAGGIVRLNNLNTSSATQKWTFEQVSGSVYRIKCQGGKYLHADGNTDGANISMQDLNTSWTSQQWTLELVSGDTYRIRNNWGGQYLHADGDGDGAGVRIKTLNTTWDSQKWILSDIASGRENISDEDSSFTNENLSSTVYPNPSTGTVAFVKYNVVEQSNVEIVLYSILHASPVMTLNISNVGSGSHEKEINTQSLENGMYLLQINKVNNQGGVDRETMKLVVSK
jgi:endoglucanase